MKTENKTISVLAAINKLVTDIAAAGISNSDDPDFAVRLMGYAFTVRNICSVLETDEDVANAPSAIRRTVEESMKWKEDNCYFVSEGVIRAHKWMTEKCKELPA